MTEIDKVRVLDDREQAREKLPIFFGSRDNYIHPLKELIANGTDELNSKFKNGTIKVKHAITENNESLITVEDSGRGLPIGEFDDEGTSYIELLLLTLFAGGKYDNNEGMTGLNGLGLTVTNYTSKYFKVESAYNGQLHTVVFTDGGQNQKYTTKKIAKTKHFTRVSYILDNKVYTSNKLKDNDINDWVSKVSAVAPKIDFTFTDSTGEEFKYHYKDLPTYFEDIVGGLSTSAIFLNEKDGVFEFDNKENNKYEVLFTTQATPVHQVFLNGTPFSEDSSIDSGVVNGIRLWFEKQYEGKRKVKPFTNQDIIDSVSYVVNVVSSNAEFSNQTKLSTKKKLYQSQTKQSVQDILDSFKDKHAVYFNRFEKHLLQVQEANHKSDNNKTKLLKKLNENIDAIKGRVEGFIDSREHGLESEFFLTEGKSALGSVVAARDSKFQAALPLRGKILNVEKAKQSEITANQEISNILKIIGGGYGKDFDIDKARFGKVIISSDQDSDGFHIQALIISLFNTIARPMLEQGRIYIAKTPLYIIHFTDKDDVLYISSEAEMDKVRPTLKNVRTISRVKGLGELDAQTMHDTAMNPETRQITQVTFDDVEQANKMIQNWLGSKNDYRKDYIIEHLPEFLVE